MLVIHGDKDYRVPIGEGLRLWWDLLAQPERPGDACRTGSSTSPTRTTGSSSPSTPIVWYETVLAFLAQHVLGEDAEMP